MGLSRPPHPLYVETIKNQLFQDNHTLPTVETVKNEFFQDHHTLTRYQLLNISSFNNTMHSQVESVKNEFFQDHHTCPK